MNVVYENEHLIALILFTVVSSLFYLFAWYIPNKIINSEPGEFDYQNIKKKIKNKIEKLKRDFKRWY